MKVIKNKCPSHSQGEAEAKWWRHPLPLQNFHERKRPTPCSSWSIIATKIQTHRETKDAEGNSSILSVIHLKGSFIHWNMVIWDTGLLREGGAPITWRLRKKESGACLQQAGLTTTVGRRSLDSLGVKSEMGRHRGMWPRFFLPFSSMEKGKELVVSTIEA